MARIPSPIQRIWSLIPIPIHQKERLPIRPKKVCIRNTDLNCEFLCFPFCKIKKIIQLLMSRVFFIKSMKLGEKHITDKFEWTFSLADKNIYYGPMPSMGWDAFWSNGIPSCGIESLFAPAGACDSALAWSLFDNT